MARCSWSSSRWRATAPLATRDKGSAKRIAATHARLRHRPTAGSMECGVLHVNVLTGNRAEIIEYAALPEPHKQAFPRCRSSAGRSPMAAAFFDRDADPLKSTGLRPAGWRQLM
jgi:hypothetical protein